MKEKVVEKKEHSKAITARFLTAVNKIIGDRLLGVSSRQDVADKLNTHRQIFRNMEDGIRYPTLENVHDLCELFGISPSWMILGKGNMHALEASLTDKDISRRLAAIERRLEIVLPAQKAVKK